jgi:crotonyl-CoA carboxylase/reductase
VRDFHVGGSDLSGIVYAVGDDITNVSVGDHVVAHPGYWDPNDPWIAAGNDQMIAPSARIWGYDTNYGSFGQFSRVQTHQVLPKAPHLTWEEAAAPTLVGTTAYRMLHGCVGNTVQQDDLVLVWGGSGGLGTQASQLVTAAGARAIAVVSDDERGEYATKYGAIGYINRREFSHWGIPPLVDDTAGQKEWTAQARAFGKKIWEIAGERKGSGNRLRAPWCRHRSDEHLHLPTRRHGGDLCGNDRIRRHGRSPLPLDPPEAVPGFSRHQRRSGHRLQRPGR